MRRLPVAFSLVLGLGACQLRQAFNDPDGDGVAGKRDCEPADPSVYPDAPEIFDGRDNNCDQNIDESYDLDEDEHFAWPLGDDCDDGNSAVYPGVSEVCGDGVDNDCDGVAGMSFPDALALEDLLDLSDEVLELYCDAPSCVEGDASGSLGSALVTGDLALNESGGDAVPGLFVGEPGYEGAEGGSGGRVHIWRAAEAANDGGRELVLVGELTGETGSNFGESLAAGGDVDGDGARDLLVGASGTGTAWLYLGLSALEIVEGVRLEEEGEGDLNGTVLLLPDEEGDGLAEIVLGSEDSELGEGGVWLLKGTSELAALAGEERGVDVRDEGLYLEGGASNLGFSAAALGNALGQGWTGLALGAPEAEGCTTEGGGPGAVWLLEHGELQGALMDAPGESTPDKALASCVAGVSEPHEGSAQPGFGEALAGGDLDGDGYVDLLVGAPGADRIGEQDVGVVLLFQGIDAMLYGGDLSMDDATTRLEGAYTGQGVGSTVSLPGDIDGDGVGDILIGSDFEQMEVPAVAELTGGAWLVAGTSSEGWSSRVDLAVDASVHHLSSGAVRTWSVADGGRLDGDMEAEWIFGVPEHESQSGLFCVLWGQGG